MIFIKNLSFSYKKIPVLNNISHTIGQGEHWAVIGRNGAGKSTLIRCIAGLQKSYSGSILIKGRELREYTPKELAKIVAYVPQTRNGIPPYTVYDYVMMSRFPYQGIFAAPSNKDKASVEKALVFTDTNDLKDQFLRNLSGGELQRVYIAGAVAQETGILLLDEPTTFLDPLHHELILATISKIHEHYATTILSVTHDITSSIYRYDNILPLVNHTIFWAGTLSDFLLKTPEILKDIYGITFDSIMIKESNKHVFSAKYVEL